MLKLFKSKVKTSRPRILVVDDEADLVSTVQCRLEANNYDVITAADGQEGLNLYLKEKERIDLIILDLSMPHLSGGEVLEQLHAQVPDAKVIISSGYAKDGRSESLQRIGAMAYVGKPYQPAELARAVRRALDGTFETQS